MNLSKKVGLRIIVDKTKIQKIAYFENDANMFLEGAPLEVVGNFIYLGSNLMLVILKKMSKVELEKTPSSNCLVSKVISLTFKLRLYNSVALSTALYACETWKVTTKITNLLDVFHLSCLRITLRYSEETKQEMITY